MNSLFFNAIFQRQQALELYAKLFRLKSRIAAKHKAICVEYTASEYQEVICVLKYIQHCYMNPDNDKNVISCTSCESVSGKFIFRYSRTSAIVGCYTKIVPRGRA